MVREFELWDKDTMPNTEHKLNLWIRDGWFENETAVEKMKFEEPDKIRTISLCICKEIQGPGIENGNY